MIVYGVHSYAWGRVGEIELLSAHKVVAEDHARQRSEAWAYGSMFVTSRELEEPGGVHEMSEWKNGEKIKDFGPGEWRKVRSV
jgi:hypothetical protein